MLDTITFFIILVVLLVIGLLGHSPVFNAAVFRALKGLKSKEEQVVEEHQVLESVDPNPIVIDGREYKILKIISVGEEEGRQVVKAQVQDTITREEVQKEFYEDQIRFGNKTKALLKSTTQCTVAKNDEMNDLIEDRVKLILTIRKLELQNKALRADYESITLKEIGHVADIKKTAGATNIVMQPDSVQKDKNEFIKKVNEQQSE